MSHYGRRFFFHCYPCFEPFAAGTIRLFPYADFGEGTDNPKSAQKPQDNNDDHNNVQDRLDGTRHGDETVDEPEKNADHDEDYHYMD
jgi:hypothetical protein